MELFRRRGREISEVERREEPKKRVMSMLFSGGDGQDVSMSTIAETLREIEQEKQMASEERYYPFLNTITVILLSMYVCIYVCMYVCMCVSANAFHILVR